MTTILIDPGMLRMRLELEEPVETPDGQGGVTRSWRPAGGIWGRVEPVTARIEEVAARLRQTVTHRITIRYRAGNVSGMRFVRLERVFMIRTVHDPDESGRYLVCQCEEVTV